MKLTISGVTATSGLSTVAGLPLRDYALDVSKHRPGSAASMRWIKGSGGRLSADNG
jgi:hypothetical protein